MGSGSFMEHVANADLGLRVIVAANLSQLGSLPNSSIVFIDWDYINNTLGVDLGLLVKLLEHLMGKGDLVIMYTKSPDPGAKAMIEYAAAVAWGNYYKSSIIGFPVMNVRGPAYVVAYGGGGLMITVIPLHGHYIDTLSLVIDEWARLINASKAWTSPLSFIRGGESTLRIIDEDACSYIAEKYGYELNGSHWSLFWTGPNTIYDSGGDVYEYDYCILTTRYFSQGLVPVEFYGFMDYSPTFMGGGRLIHYDSGLYVSTSYGSIRQLALSGYNSYIDLSTLSGIEPVYIDYALFSYRPLIMTITMLSIRTGHLDTIEFIYAPQSPSGSLIGGYTESVKTTSLMSTSMVFLYDISWLFSITDRYGNAARLVANANYPVGFGLDYSGTWYLAAGVNKLNTAVSPLYVEYGLACKQTDNGSWQEYFGGAVYFILQYNPAAKWSIGDMPPIDYIDSVAPYNTLILQCSCSEEIYNPLTILLNH